MVQSLRGRRETSGTCGTTTTMTSCPNTWQCEAKRLKNETFYSYEHWCLVFEF